MTTGKTIALTTWTFVGKVMFLLFNNLSRFVTAFLPMFLPTFKECYHLLIPRANTLESVVFSLIVLRVLFSQDKM